MPLNENGYDPRTDDELYSQASDDLQSITDGDVEDAESSAVQAFVKAYTNLLADNQEQSLQQLYDAGYIETASGDELDKKVRENGIQRKPSTPATGIARFTRSSPPTNDFIIPSNLPITTNNGSVTFTTVESGSILALDTFDNNSISSAYDGDTSFFSQFGGRINVPPVDGKAIYRTDVTVEEGDRIDTRFTLDADTALGVRFGVQGADSYYTVVVSASTSTVQLVKSDGSETQLDSDGVSIPTDTELTLEIDWSLPNDLEARLIDGDNTIASVSTSDETFTEGGIGFASRDNSGNKLVSSITTTATTLTVKGAQGGEQTNLGSDRLTVLPSPPTGITGVTNPIPTGDPDFYDTRGRRLIVGTDRETDEELRERALESSARGGAGTVPAIRSALYAVDNVISVSAVENDDVTQDSAGRPPLSVEFIVYGGTDADIANTLHDNVAFTERLVGGYDGTEITYTISDELLDDDETYSWSEPPIDDVDISLDIVVDGTYAGDDAVKSAVVNYVGGRDIDGGIVNGVTIGDDVRLDAIRDRVVGDELGVRGIASLTIDANGDGTDDTTTDANGLDVYEVSSSAVAQTDALDDSITITTTEI